MKSRMIINIDGVDEQKAIECVRQVIGAGKISDHGESYCYCTVIDDEYGVYAKTSKTGTHVFYVCRELPF